MLVTVIAVDCPFLRVIFLTAAAKFGAKARHKYTMDKRMGSRHAEINGTSRTWE